MNNATIIAERDSLRAAFIRYIALDQFIGCGCTPTTSTPTLKTCRAPCRGGAMGEVVSNLSSTIEDVVFNVLNECKTFRTEAE